MCIRDRNKFDIEVKNVKLRCALDYLVKVVAGCYWFVSDGAVFISKEKPSPGGPLKRAGLAALAGRFPEVAEILGSKEITVGFDGKKLTEVATVLRDKSGIHVFLDPDFHMDPPLVSVPLNDYKMKDVLNIIALYVDCAWDVRFGGVYVAPREELDRVPRSIPLPGEDLTGSIEAKLNSKISLDLDRTPLVKVIEDLKKQGIPIRISSRAKTEGAEHALISCNVGNLELRYALEAVLLPVGLKWKLEKGEIVVVPQ